MEKIERHRERLARQLKEWAEEFRMGSILGDAETAREIAANSDVLDEAAQALTIVDLVLGHVPIDGERWEVRVRVGTEKGEIQLDPKVRLHKILDDDQPFDAFEVIRKVVLRDLSEILAGFEYPSSRPFVGMRNLPNHAIAPLASYLEEIARSTEDKTGGRYEQGYKDGAMATYTEWRVALEEFGGFEEDGEILPLVVAREVAELRETLLDLCLRYGLDPKGVRDQRRESGASVVERGPDKKGTGWVECDPPIPDPDGWTIRWGAGRPEDPYLLAQGVRKRDGDPPVFVRQEFLREEVQSLPSIVQARMNYHADRFLRAYREADGESTENLEAAEAILDRVKTQDEKGDPR